MRASMPCLARQARTSVGSAESPISRPATLTATGMSKVGSTLRQRAICPHTSSTTQRVIRSDRPLTSATPMKRSGVSRPKVGCCQRISASSPTTLPLLIATCGWYSTTNCTLPVCTALSSWMPNCASRTARSWRIGLKKLNRLPPSRLARYIAASAFFSNVLMSRPCSGNSATPIEAEAWVSILGTRSVRCSDSTMRAATSATSWRCSNALSSTTNSSPPRRATMPPPPTVSFTTCAADLISASPTTWPSVSLTSLKRSRSISMTAMRRRRLDDDMIMSRMVSRSRLRLGRPVSESYHASCSMRPSAS